MSPVRYRIEPPILRVHLEAPYDEGEVEAAARAVFEDPAFVPGLDVLAEVPLGRGPSSDELRARAKLIAELAPRMGGRIAVVVRRDVDFGLGRMFGAFVEEHGLEVRIFRETAAAESWLRSGDGV